MMLEYENWEKKTCIWSTPNNLWLHLRASCRYLRAICTFPMPSSIIATFIYVAAVFGWDSPHVKWRRNKARLTYLEINNGFASVIDVNKKNKLTAEHSRTSQKFNKNEKRMWETRRRNLLSPKITICNAQQIWNQIVEQET